jgi:putative transposase
VKAPLVIPAQPNEVWAAAFMSDALWSGHRLRKFNVIDNFNREVLRIETYSSLPARRIVRSLDELVEIRGKPIASLIDNGPELISDELDKWARRNTVERRFI